MKKANVTFSIALLMMVLLIPKVSALENTSEEDYNRLRTVFSEARLSLMSDEEAQQYLAYDLENTIKVSKYYKVIDNTNGTTNIEVTEEEAENAKNGIMPASTDSTYSTSYKQIQLSASPGVSNRYMVDFSTVWFINPKVKSYDVIAMRGDDADPLAESQSGYQIYRNIGSSTYSEVNYAHDGTNIVKKANGFGISMNLVDNSDYFQMEIDAVFTATSKYAKLYGSYQHAIVNVTLAESQNYNISHNGLGKVINFYGVTESYYDQMLGVSLDLEYTA